MHRKQSEEEFRAMASGHGFYFRKARDAAYFSCPVCHTVLTTCPVCHKDMLMKKSENLPDYLMAEKIQYVECKQGDETWSITDFTDIQLKVLNEHAHDSWFFLLMSDGKNTSVLKGGRRAFFIPWYWWTLKQAELLGQGYGSIRFERTARSKMPTLDDVFMGGFELKWEKGKWRIPDGHSWFEPA